MYSHNQLDVIYTVTILKDLGVPLKEIKNILQNTSPQNIAETLEYQLYTLDSKIRRLTQLKEMTELRLDQINTGIKASRDAHNFAVTTLKDDVPFFVGREIDEKQNQSLIDDEIIAFFEKAEKNGIPLIFAFGQIKTKQDVLSKRFDRIHRLCCRLKTPDLANFYMPKGKYIIGYGKGDYTDTYAAYNELLDFSEDMGLTLTDDVFEEYLVDELAEKNAENFVFQISVRVK